MRFSLFLSFLIAGLAVVFATQNTAVVDLRFLKWHLEGSLAILMLLSFAAGFLCYTLLAVPRVIRRRRAIGELKRRIAVLENERQASEEKAAQKIPTPRYTSTIE